MQEKTQLLDDTKWLPGLSWQELTVWAEQMMVYEIKNATTIIEEGSTDRSLAIISSGTVAVTKTDRNSRRRTLVRLGKGKAFGEMSLVDGAPRSAGIMTIEPTTLLVLFDVAFNIVMKERPDLAAKLLYRIAALISFRLRQSNARLVDTLFE